MVFTKVMKILPILTFLSSSLFALKFSPDHEKVTYGSAIKLTHSVSGYKLHSHEIAYGSGSGQQSITAFPESTDKNSYFIVEGAHGIATFRRGTAVKCNDKVRLKHLATNKYLHSHLHSAPLSGFQEVSGFDNNNSNKGDNWIVKCVDKSATNWMREKNVNLVHEETGLFLFSSKSFTYHNPIPGQLEVSAVDSFSKDCNWNAQEGIYFSDNLMF
jgi:dolichyl-phosphate-mannose--protein O-mannosyl transferase